MLLVAKIQRRGLADRTFSESPDAIEREHGRRNALIETPGGQVFHIHDRQYFEPVVDYDNPRWYPCGKGPDKWPRRGDGLVVIETRGATRDHGEHFEPRRWVRASDFRERLAMSFAITPGAGYIAQPALVDLIMDFLRDDFGPCSPEEWRDLEARMDRLQPKGVDPCYLQYLKSLYLIGSTEDRARRHLD